jgi:hypothetical protein
LNTAKDFDTHVPKRAHSDGTPPILMESSRKLSPSVPRLKENVHHFEV